MVDLEGKGLHERQSKDFDDSLPSKWHGSELSPAVHGL